ncbi:SCP2 sterol-binding domain-containing protein [Oscillochloris sp. ZM17-4]|uniref:SCP2 sterol-binding domain-containing protein n=1 Tax=Oscillochloris sp. ZM17-4 TaxID=2866714 RepID=UPI001C730629|nr:SCP2 sterol-binding domain-containing protein [Oscillochloris sp. ZM17-4]MBX0329527.1 SCP2 sterol-binding domain-containing protein [Oscillochloris sp. ZM17-4]
MIAEDQRAAAAAAPAHIFDDRIGAFAGYTLAADLLELREIYAGYLRRIPDDAWSRRTERRPSGWTLIETLAHLDAAAGVFNTSVEQAIAGGPIAISGIARRTDLPAANRAAIDARLSLGPAAITSSLLDALTRAAAIASRLSPGQLAMQVQTPYYGGLPTVAEILGASLVHAGIIHGSQVAVGAGAQSIWSFYNPGMMRRQLTRAFHTMGLAYWPERGGSLHAVLAFNVEGQGGGSWFIRVDPAGGEGRIGTVRTADVTMSFASADLLCQVVTLRANLIKSVLLGHLRIRGNLRLATRIPRLFNPT